MPSFGCHSLTSHHIATVLALFFAREGNHLELELLTGQQCTIAAVEYKIAGLLRLQAPQLELECQVVGKSSRIIGGRMGCLVVRSCDSVTYTHPT